MRWNFVKTKSLGLRNIRWIWWTFIEVCPTFGHFSWHELKLMKFTWYLTVFPSHFNNIFLKSFGHLHNLMRNCEILWKLMKCHETNEISQNLIGIILYFCSVAIYVVDFQFCFLCFQKFIAKFQFLGKDLKFRSFKLGDGKSWKSQ